MNEWLLRMTSPNWQTSLKFVLLLDYLNRRSLLTFYWKLRSTYFIPCNTITLQYKNLDPMLSDIIWIGAWWGKAFPLSVMCKLVLSEKITKCSLVPALFLSPDSGPLTAAETQISFVRCNTSRSQHGPGSACYGPEPWATRRSPQSAKEALIFCTMKYTDW